MRMMFNFDTGIEPYYARTDAATLAEKCGSDVETIGAYKAHALRACETVIDLICLEF